MKQCMVVGAHGFKVGDELEMTLHDRRKWKRFLHWITFREPPTVVSTYRIIKVTTTTFTIELKEKI